MDLSDDFGRPPRPEAYDRDDGRRMHLTLHLATTVPQLPFLDRFDAAARAGFTAVECGWPPVGISPAQVRRASQAAGTGLVLVNIDPGDLAGGQRGYPSDPAARRLWREALERALEFAGETGCPLLNVLVGTRLADIGLADQLALLREHLAEAVDRAAGHGATIVIEHLNTSESPGYLIPTVADAMRVIAETRKPGLGLLLDVYQEQRQTGDVTQVVQVSMGALRHVHFADAPGRGPPGTGKIDFSKIVDRLVECNYTGYLGLEHKPAGANLEEDLAWLPRSLRSGPVDAVAIRRALHAASS